MLSKERDGTFIVQVVCSYSFGTERTCRKNISALNKRGVDRQLFLDGVNACLFDNDIKMIETDYPQSSGGVSMKLQINKRI